MKKFATIIAVLVFLSMVINVFAYEDHDFQIWNTDVEEFKIGDNSKIALEEEFRWGGNSKEFYYHHYDIGFFYNLNKYLNIGSGYRHAYELKKRKFKQENEPYLIATLSWDFKGFKFEDRNRIEYRHFDYQADSGRYRNKITMKLPYKFTKMEIQPYVSNEIFCAFGGVNQLNQNRFSVGLSLSLTRDIKTETYYMLQSSKSSGIWTDINVLGTKFKILF